MRAFAGWFRSGVFCCALAGAVVAGRAQSGGSGSIVGTVTAPGGAVVAGAAVVVANPDARSHMSASGADGTFAVKELPSGEYRVEVRAPGFAAYQDASVAVAVGRTTELAVRLRVATAQQQVTVSADNGLMDTTQTSSVTNIDRDRVEELPIPSRNYLTFVLLSPTVAPANPALQAGRPAASAGSFSFGGLRPGSNAIYLDGVNDDDEYSGGSRTQLSPEAISDFQIVNHGFAAESGGGAGGSIDVQTRTGVNRLHGDAFTFVQNGALDAKPPLELVPSRPEETRVRVGVALGGPIQRDRMFYYLAAEQEIADGQDANDLGPGTVGAVNGALRQTGPLSGLTLASGFFATTDQETELSARVDRAITASESVMLRYAFTNSRNVNDAFNTDEFADRTARGSTFVADNSLNGAWTSLPSSTRVNRFGFEVAQRRAVDRTGVSSGPGVMIPGMAMFGTPFAGNDRRFETHTEFADTFSAQMKRHLFTGGARADRVALRARVADASQGWFAFPTLAALQDGDADFFAQSFGNFDTNLTEVRYAAFAQDHWTVTPALTVDYGLRYEVNRLPAALPQDTVNFSPRAGVAWEPWRSMTVRSGFGIFFDRFQLSTINRLLEMDGAHGFMQIVEDKAAAAVYRSGAVMQAPLSGVAPSVWRAQPDLRNPYSEVGSLSVEQALPWQATLKAEYEFVHGVRLGRTSNVNLPPPMALTAQNAASLGVSSPSAQQLGRLVFSPARQNATYDAINEFSTSAGSNYNGATITVNRQFQDDVQIMAGYTFSKAIDDASYDDEQPQNPYAFENERSLSLLDQRHRLTLSGLWVIGPDLGDPADAGKNAHPGPWLKAVYGLEFAPILTVTSGFRANPVTGLDSNREHIFPFAARPTGYARNSLHTPANVVFDLRALKMVALGRGHLDIVAESFNLPNHRNVSLVNPVYGLGAAPDAGFGTAMAAFPARKVQFSLDYEF
ncbi:MAG TPA: TonB-dependent receptor [Acidobacteriaceae bacterium]